jgi:hypothetical protein
VILKNVVSGQLDRRQNTKNNKTKKRDKKYENIIKKNLGKPYKPSLASKNHNS